MTGERVGTIYTFQFSRVRLKKPQSSTKSYYALIITHNMNIQCALSECIAFMPAVTYCFCPVWVSVCLSVVNFNIGYNYWTVRDGDFAFGMHQPLMMSYRMTRRSVILTDLCANNWFFFWNFFVAAGAYCSCLYCTWSLVRQKPLMHWFRYIFQLCLSLKSIAHMWCGIGIRIVPWSFVFLAHLSQRLKWAIVIAHRPSSVRPSVVRPSSVVRL